MNTTTVLGITTLGATLALAASGQTPLANAVALVGAGACCYALRAQFGRAHTAPASQPEPEPTAYDLEPEHDTYNSTLPTAASYAPAASYNAPAASYDAPTASYTQAITGGQVVQFLDRCATACQRLNLNPQLIPSYESLRNAGVAISPNQRAAYLRLLRGYIVKIRAGGAERYIVKRGSIWQLLQLAQRGALRLAD